jgi:hypothetical protein
MKMCLRTEKPLLCCGFSAILYSYLLISGSVYTDVLNIGVEGDGLSTSPLATVSKYYENHRRVWVHSITGDVYDYDAQNYRWSPLGNLGMRYVPHVLTPKRYAISVLSSSLKYVMIFLFL